MKKVYIIVCFILIVIGGVLFVEFYKLNNSSKSLKASAEVKMYSESVEAFYKYYGKWPTNLIELIENKDGIIYISDKQFGIDPWGKSYIFTPYDDELKFGSVISYGADGQPGGKGWDLDLESKCVPTPEMKENEPVP